MTTLEKTQEGVFNARKLLQFCQLLDKYFLGISRCVGNFFEVFLKFLFIYFTISRGTHEDVLRNRGGTHCCDIGVFVNLTKKAKSTPKTVYYTTFRMYW